MNLNFWPKMYYSGGGGGGGSGGGGGAAGGGAAGEQPPEEPTPVGAFRFNTDTLKLEYYDGNQWVIITTDSPAANTGATRGLIQHNCLAANAATNVIQFINVTTSGDSADFGDDSKNIKWCSGAGSHTRAIWSGSYNPGTTDNIRFSTYASQGDTIDFGDMSYTAIFNSSASNSTRVVMFGGSQSPARVNNIEYITISHLGNAVDFGDTTYINNYATAFGSPTRGVFSGGYSPSIGINTQNYITYSTTGNAADFGDLTYTGSAASKGKSNAVTGLVVGGQTGSSPYYVDSTNKVTIASLGSAIDDGDHSSTITYAGAMSSPTRLVLAGGIRGGSISNAMTFKQIGSSGGYLDFGDLSAQVANTDAHSNGHGGLG